MELIEGEVVFVPFPFSDLTQNRKRPAVVLKQLPGSDVILCPITKVEPELDENFITLTRSSFAEGALRINPSYARPCKLFTADSGIILFKVGKLKSEVFRDIRLKASQMF